MEIDQSEKQIIFQIPCMSKESKKTLNVVGLLDASGSMSSYWSYLVRAWNKILKDYENATTITFSDVSKIVTEKQIEEDIEKYDCSGTNIMAGFLRLDEYVQSRG